MLTLEMVLYESANRVATVDNISYEAKLQNLTMRSQDFAEERRAFLVKRTPSFTGR
jgi:hypothetical protein